MTIISLSSPIEEAAKVIKNFDDIKESLTKLTSCTDFRFYNNQEIIVEIKR